MNPLALSRINDWSVGELLIAVVVVGACLGLVYVALRQFGVAIPGWVMQVLWIVAVAVVVIFAIRFILSL